MNRFQFLPALPEGSPCDPAGRCSVLPATTFRHLPFSRRQRIQRGNRMPASFMVDASAPAPFEAFELWRSAKALVRDGSRTRDRQSCSLMLYPLSYFVRCSCRTRCTEHGIPIATKRGKPRRRNPIGRSQWDRHSVAWTVRRSSKN